MSRELPLGPNQIKEKKEKKFGKRWVVFNGCWVGVIGEFVGPADSGEAQSRFCFKTKKRWWCEAG